MPKTISTVVALISDPRAWGSSLISLASSSSVSSMILNDSKLASWASMIARSSSSSFLKQRDLFYSKFFWSGSKAYLLSPEPLLKALGGIRLLLLSVLGRHKLVHHLLFALRPVLRQRPGQEGKLHIEVLLFRFLVGLADLLILIRCLLPIMMLQDHLPSTLLVHLLKRS